jgi:putative ABC transport system permease protein
LTAVLALLLLALPGYVLARLDLPLLKRTGRGVVRMVAQVAAVGALTWALWKVPSPWLCLLWLLAVTMVATWVLLSRSRLSVQRLFLPTWIAMTVAVAVSGVLALLAMGVDHLLAPRWVVTTGAVLTAHVLTTNIRGLSTYFETLRTDSTSYYAQLGNGASRPVALTPYVRQALRSMMEPTVAAMAVTGLPVLPMLLSGLLMGGLSPLVATVLFLVLMMAGLTASVGALLLTVWLADKSVFDKRGALKP